MRQTGTLLPVRIFGGLGGLFLGGMLLLAGVLKSSDPGLFIMQIRGYEILPQYSALWAYLVVWAEFVLAVMLILRLAPRPALLGTVALMVFFIGVTIWAWANGNTDACGCFGRVGGRHPREVIIEDLAYIAIAAFSYWTAPWISRSRIRWGVGLVALPLLAAGPWILPRLPIDSLITPLKPGVSLQTLAADDVRVPLDSGTVFLVFLGDDCPRCEAALPTVYELARTPGAPRVNGLFAGSRAESRAWVLKHIPPFAVAHSPEKAMRQYYRALPVFVLAREGIIQALWYGEAPPVREVMEAASK